MKILVVASSKDNTQIEFCNIAKEVIKNIKNCELDFLPLSNCGKGTIECFSYAKDCQIMKCFVQNAIYEEEVCSVAFLENGKTAIIEACQSNHFIKGVDNEITSTYGVGQLIGFACDMGAKNIVLALGDCVSKDLGLGILAALGGCFYNKDGVSFVPTEKTLKDVQEIDLSMMYPRLQGARFEAFCDEQDILFDKENKGIVHIASLFNKMRTTDFSLEKGSGCFGGLGFCVLAALNGSLKKTNEKVLSLLNFSKKVLNYDLIITNDKKLFECEKDILEIDFGNDMKEANDMKECFEKEFISYYNKKYV